MQKTFFLYENGQVSPPYTMEELKAKNLTGDTMICEKFGTWKPVREVPELEELWEWTPAEPYEVMSEPLTEKHPEVVSPAPKENNPTAQRRPLIPASFGLAAFCFLFAFCDLKCGDQTLTSVTGIEFVSGLDLDEKGLSDYGQAGSSYVPPNLWAVLALFLALSGCAAYLLSKQTDPNVGVIIGVIGAVALLALQTHVKMSYEKEGDGALIAEFQPAYWISLLAMIVAAILSGSLPSGAKKLKRSGQPTPHESPPPPPIQAPPLAPKTETPEEPENETHIEVSGVPQLNPEANINSKKGTPKSVKIVGGLIGVAILMAGGYFLIPKLNSDVSDNPNTEISHPDGSRSLDAPSINAESSDESQRLAVIIIAQKNLNIRDRASVEGGKLGLIKQLEEVTVIERGSKDIVEGIEDYWYKVSYKNQTGYVFGHYTNLKLQGQKTVILPFEGCAFGDLFHLTFGNAGSNSKGYLDFGQGMNNYSGFEFCLESSEGDNYPNPKYVGQRFKITYNELFAKIYCNAPVSYDEMCIVPVKTIVKLELADQPTAATPNTPSKLGYQFDRHSDIEIFMDDLAKAVNNKDKEALAKMIHFPLVDAWGDNPANETPSLGCKDKKQFMAKYDMIFSREIAQNIRNKKYRAYVESEFEDVIHRGEYLVENNEGIGMLGIRKIAGTFKIYALKFYS